MEWDLRTQVSITLERAWWQYTGTKTNLVAISFEEPV